MKIVMVTLQVMEEDDVEPLIKQAKKQGALPIISLIADEVGSSKWIGTEFHSIVVDEVFKGNIENQRIVFFMKS